jgi:hypothetical protein
MVRTSSLFFIVLLTMMSCKIVEDTQGDVKTISTFRIAMGDVSGWPFEEDWEWKTFSKNQMFDVVNGDAQDFVNWGLIEGAAQKLVNSTSEKIQFWILDFASDANATSAFKAYIAKRFTTQKPINGFAQSIAIIDDSSIDGCKTVARFGQFIIVAFYTNFNEQSQSISTAEEFLKTFQVKQR